MIYTLTLNPAVDYTVFLDALRPGQIHRTDGEKIAWGGKGINVSRVLKVLGVESTALGFIAGFTGKALAEGLAKEHIACDFITLSRGNTRMNVKIVAGEETEINGSGPEISEFEFDLLLKKIQKLSSSDTLVLSGSAPASFSPAMYKKLLRMISATGPRFVADVSGEALAAVLEFRPYFIKPNRAELSALCGRELRRETDIREAAMAVAARGIHYVLVSLGGEGAALATAEGAYFTVKAPQGQVYSTVGAGDALLAGFLTAVQSDSTALQQALKMGVAAGSAAAFTAPANTLQADQIQNLYNSEG